MERKWHQNRIDYPISVTSVNPHTLVDVRNNCYLLNSPCAESKRSKTFRFIYLKFGLRATLISISCAVDIIYFEYLFSIKSLCCHDIFFFSFVRWRFHSFDAKYFKCRSTEFTRTGQGGLIDNFASATRQEFFFSSSFRRNHWLWRSRIGSPS